MAQANGPLLWIDNLPVYPLCGAEGESGTEQGGAQSGSNGQQSGAQSGSASDAGGQGASGASGGQTGQSAGDATVSRAEFDALTARLSAADKKREDAESRLREIDDANKTATEKAEAERDEAKAENQKLRERLDQMSLSNAFHEAKDTPTWHSSSAALQLLDRSLITIEDGKVKGMDAAVKKLKDDHPYLVKTGDAGDGKGGGQQQSGQTGAGNNGSGTGGSKSTSREDQSRRFPVLRTRV